ncbi:MAG: hypothetical protein MUC62_08795 [Candidatus Thermoplasmatota archaeon]|jgi:hypothetical protein|nr:hypothetical protein [Candidatus Thermoplasmatota archaeon]
MNKPTLITGIGLFTVGLLLVIIGFAIGGSSLNDQVYEEVANEADFNSPRAGTFTYDYSPDSSLGTKIDIVSRTTWVLLFDLTIEDSMESSVLSQKSRMTPYSRELDLTLLDTYTITIVFEVNVTLTDFSIILWENTFSDSFVASCCMGLFLPGLGGLLMLVGLILIIVGLVVGRKKEVMPDPWNRPQDLYPPKPTYPPSQPVQPAPPMGGYGYGGPPQGPNYGPPHGGDGTFSPNILRPPPVQ